MTQSDASEFRFDCVKEFGRRRVLILGDAILDEYLFGDCSRISPEAPVPILRVTGTRRVLGGAANTAANVASLGGHAALVALVGSDEGGSTLARCALDAGVELFGIDHGLRTLRKTRVVGQHQQIVRLDYEGLPIPGSDAADRVLTRFRNELARCDLVVMSDYAKGFVSAAVAETIISAAHEAGRRVIVDPRPQNKNCYVGCDYITPNWRECCGLLGWPETEPTPEGTEEGARALSAALGANVVLTLGAHGIAFYGRDGEDRFTMPTLAREVFDVSGAGDTVVAALALALASGASHHTAVALANKAASVVVGKFGTATVSADEILQDTAASRVLPRTALRDLATTMRAKRRRIVTINGSFDVLHAGHLQILNEARQLGDVLIVGLNSDRSVRSYKGPDRPIVPERERAEMLLALRMVDFVHVFDEPDPIAFLEEVRPDVHVNGAEYGEDCVEAEAVKRNGGQLHLVNRVSGLSTTRLVERARMVSTPDSST